MSLESGQLLLSPDTTVTCPKCSHEFSLDQGFAKKALEQLSEASAGAIAAMREAEREQVERRAEQLAGEQARAAKGDVESLKKLLKDQGEANAKSLAEVRSVAEKSLTPRLEEMPRAIAGSDSLRISGRAGTIYVRMSPRAGAPSTVD